MIESNVMHPNSIVRFALSISALLAASLLLILYTTGDYVIGQDPQDFVCAESSQSGVAQWMCKAMSYHAKASASVAVEMIMERLREKVRNRLEIAAAYKKTQTAVEKSYQAHFITHDYCIGRLGNFMFWSASMLGIARKNRMHPIYLFKDKRADYFAGLFFGVIDNSTEEYVSSLVSWETPRFAENGSATYMPDAKRIREIYSNTSVVLTGWFQSWKYFWNIREEVAAMLTFNNKIQQAALQIVARALQKFIERGVFSTMQSIPQLVGVHVRRTDFLLQRWRSIGSAVVPDSYFHRAVVFMKRKYPSAVFIVVGDDLAYCRNTFQGKEFFITDTDAAQVHMAVLSLMDQMIVSIGTFGWWGAFLSNSSNVLYFNGWPQKHTILSKAVRLDDFIPRNWIGDF